MGEQVDEKSEKETISVRSRRARNWWEPMYDPNPPEHFILSDWGFENHIGLKHMMFLAEKIKSEKSLIVEGITFEECDFQGNFEKPIIFKRCTFRKCDLGLSTFVRTKFTDCVFCETSFTQCILDNCELRGCSYEKIHFSGNETQVPNTLITNPSNFVFGASASYSHLPKGRSKIEQCLRFKETRSTISRSILAELQSEGSEESYYNAVRTAAISEDIARISRGFLRVHSVFFGKKKVGFFRKIIESTFGLLSSISATIGIFVLICLGFLNGWGGSISRALIFGIISIIVFSYLHMYCFDVESVLAVLKSIEIFLLFGYTNYSSSDSPDFYLVFGNAIFGFFWYVIAIPTIVNRLTRARG